MSHQKIDLIPWRDNCIIDDKGKCYDIFFLFQKEKSAMVANRWIRNMVNEKDKN